MAIATRTTQVLRDLGEAIGHGSGHLGARLLRQHRRRTQLGPLAGGSEAVEGDEGSAKSDGMTDLDDSLEARDGVLVDLIASEQFRIVEEVTQEPAELPEGFGSAVEPAGNHR